MNFCLIILTVLSLSFSSPDELSKIYNVIKHVETNNNAEAVGDNGKAYGIVQIHKIAVDDVNRIYGTSYVHEDAFDEVCAREIFNLYILAGIKRFKVQHCRDPTEQDIVRFWNGGIYSGHKRNTTLKYYKRYLKFKEKLYKKDLNKD